MRISGLIIGAIALLPSLASAQVVDTGQGRIELLGEAPAACLLRAPVASNAVNATFGSATATSAEIQIVQLANPQTAQAQAASIDLALPVVCNSAHRLTIRSLNGGLLRDGATTRVAAAADGLGEFVGYQLGARWAGTEVSVESAVTNVILIDSARAAVGDVQLRFAVSAGGSALIAGRYADAVIVEFQAAN
jgi:hypothetical protein